MPVEISTLLELQAIDLDRSGSYVLVNDIDASETSTWNGGEGFSPIGPALATPFYGQIDGAGHTIDGLYISRSDRFEALVGMMGSASLTGYIHDLLLTNVNVTANDSYVAGICGYNRQGTIRRCGVSGVVTRLDGGSESRTGGISGAIWTDSVTGIAAIVEDCFSTVLITTYRALQQGIVVGRCNGTITNCYGAGTAAGPYAADVKGVGHYTGGSATGCYWDADIGPATSGVGIPKTTAQMKQQATFTNWDFETIWYIDEGVSYPELRVFMDLAVFGLLSPPDLSSDLSLPLLLQWQDVGAAYYNVQVASDAEFSTILLDEITTIPEYTITEIAVAENYYWRVRYSL